MTTCRTCGAEMGEGFAFCGECGTPAAATGPATGPVTEPERGTGENPVLLVPPHRSNTGPVGSAPSAPFPGPGPATGPQPPFGPGPMGGGTGPIGGGTGPISGTGPVGGPMPPPGFGGPPTGPLPPFGHAMPPMPPAPRRTLGPGAIAGIILGALLLIGGIFAIAANSGGPSHTLSGTASVYDSSFYDESDGTSCSAPYNYSDVTATDAVVVTGSSHGSRRTTLYGGTVSGSSCDFHFSLTVPDADSYRIEVGDQGSSTYSRYQLEAENWDISISVGGTD